MIRVTVLICWFVIGAQTQGYNYNKQHQNYVIDSMMYPNHKLIKGQHGYDYDVTMFPSQKLYEARVVQTPTSTELLYDSRGGSSVASAGSTANYQTNGQQQFFNGYHYDRPHIQGNLISNQQAIVSQQHYTEGGHNEIALNNRPILHNRPAAIVASEQLSLNVNNIGNSLQHNLQDPRNTIQSLDIRSNAGSQLDFQNTAQHLTFDGQGNGNSLQHFQQGRPQNAAQQLAFNSNGNSVQHSAQNALQYSNQQNYISQSQATQLNVYPYQKITNLHSRPFTKIITKCYVDGRCLQENAATDEDHQHVLEKMRAYVATSHAEVAPTLSAIARPKDRRLFGYSEVPLVEYPHN